VVFRTQTVFSLVTPNQIFASFDGAGTTWMMLLTEFAAQPHTLFAAAGPFAGTLGMVLPTTTIVRSIGPN
jgi:hypothetical protein